jgi:energy-coupling factor transporter ATP-binding protein EcfA2
MAIDLPEGFELDPTELPQGFQVDSQNIEQPSQPEINQQPNQDAYMAENMPLIQNPVGRTVENIGRGINLGLGNAFIGATQTVNDMFEKIANRKTEFGTRLAEQAKIREQQQSQLPLSQRIGTGIGEALPYLNVGMGTGSAIAASGLKGAKYVGLAVGGGISGLASGGLSMQPETGLENRGEEALQQGAFGAIAAPAIGAVISGVKKTPNLFKNLFTKDSAEEVGKKALDPETAKLALKELVDKPSDKPLTAIDIQNPEFKTYVRSVIAKYPQAREIVKDFAEGRNNEAFTRINKDLKIISKVDNADDYIKQISDTQKATASPLYAEAEADRTIVPKFEFKEVKTTTSPQTTTVSEGVKSFKTDSSTKSKTDFVNKYSLQGKSRATEKPLVSQEEKQLFSQGKGSLDTTKEELFNIHDRYKTALKDLKEYAPKNPLQFIKEQGGIIDEAGELKNLGINNKTIPGLLRKDGKGISIDDVGNKLYENGYFQERPSVNQVLDFIDKEARNTNIGNRATNFSKDSTKYNEAKQFLDEADSLGIDVDAIGKLKRITPQTQKTGVSGIKAGTSYDKRELSKKGIAEFQNTARKQTTTIQEGGKSVNIRKDITNLAEMSPKSRQLAQKLDELENNQVFIDTREKAKQFLNKDSIDNSVETLHATREIFDDKITLAKRSGQDKEFRRLSILRSKVDNLISEVSPVFKQADNVFRPLAIKKDAVEFGKEFTKYKPSEIVEKVNDLTQRSGLKREEILNDLKVGAKNLILENIEKLIKFEGSNIPTEIQVRELIETKFKRDQLKSFIANKDYSEFVDNINKEVLFNKASSTLGLDKSEMQQGSNFIKNAIAGLISYATSGAGKTVMAINTAKAGEAFLVKNYKGLNNENAKKIARIVINKEASVKYLENIVNQASKDQKALVSQAINDLRPIMIGAFYGDKSISDVEAKEPTQQDFNNNLE